MKNWIKVGLSLVMLFVFSVLFDDNSTGRWIHELFGLSLMGIILVHILFNIKLIKTISRKIFDKDLFIKIRIRYLFSIILLVCFILMLFSGILISEAIFKFGLYLDFDFFKEIHEVVSNICIVIVGIHLGLNINFIDSMVKKIIPLPSKGKEVILRIFKVVLFAIGCFSLLVNSIFDDYLIFGNTLLIILLKIFFFYGTMICAIAILTDYIENTIVIVFNKYKEKSEV